MKKLEVTWESKEEKIAIRTCHRCFGTGIMEVANGPDDHDQDFCLCIAGISAMNHADDEVYLEARRLTAHND